MWNLVQHDYEEIRDIVVDILLKRESVEFEISQWVNLVAGVGQVLARRAGTVLPPGQQYRLHPNDSELVRDVFWDLFRQGFITLGLNDPNPAWPFFRLSHFGQKALLTQSPYRFHDTSSFLDMVKAEVPDISPEAILYLDEAIVTFYAGCMLATCVMLGAAAEAEFLRLIDVATSNPTHSAKFAAATKPPFIRQKIVAFRAVLAPLISTLPKKATEDLETNLDMIQSVLRIARNDAGHPTATTPPQREQVYIYLQLFIPFARQLMRLRQVL